MKIIKGSGLLPAYGHEVAVAAAYTDEMGVKNQGRKRG